MINQYKDIISNTVQLIADNIEMKFEASVAPLNGKCEKITVVMVDRGTQNYIRDEYTGEEAELVFSMLAKPAMKLGYIVHKEG